MRGHGPSSTFSTSCKFWRHNREVDWLKHHAKDAESPKEQKEREARKLKKAKLRAAKDREEQTRQRAAADQAFIEDVEIGLAEGETGIGPSGSGQVLEDNVSSCLIK